MVNPPSGHQRHHKREPEQVTDRESPRPMFHSCHGRDTTRQSDIYISETLTLGNISLNHSESPNVGKGSGPPRPTIGSAHNPSSPLLSTNRKRGLPSGCHLPDSATVYDSYQVVGRVLCSASVPRFGKL